MNILTVFVIAIGLSMDAFAVSVASGCLLNRARIHHALRMGIAFGGFQAIMPIVGWFAGIGFKSLISGIDHWLAFVLLAIIGGKMIWESRKLDEEEKTNDPFALGTLFLLAIATSIDALAVGLSISFLGVDIYTPACIIGITTFALSFIGVFVGNRCGHLFEGKVELIGGIILVVIGLKILLQHIFAGA